jgi:hypothetical protein
VNDDKLYVRVDYIVTYISRNVEMQKDPRISAQPTSLLAAPEQLRKPTSRYYLSRTTTESPTACHMPTECCRSCGSDAAACLSRSPLVRPQSKKEGQSVCACPETEIG